MAYAREVTFPAGSYSALREQPPLSDEDAETVRRFHQLFYERWRITHGDTISLTWFGHLLYKCPMDLWMYQELIVERRPDVIVECGTFQGGSALYFAMLQDLLGHGEVITIDIEAPAEPPKHERITYLTGSSTDASVVADVRA